MNTPERIENFTNKMENIGLIVRNRGKVIEVWTQAHDCLAIIEYHGGSMRVSLLTSEETAFFDYDEWNAMAERIIDEWV
jgi:hypothetical protein